MVKKINLNSSNFMHYYAFHPLAKELTTKDKVKALVFTLSAGVFSLGIFHTIIGALSLKNRNFIEKPSSGYHIVSGKNQSPEEIDNETIELIQSTNSFDEKQRIFNEYLRIVTKLDDRLANSIIEPNSINSNEVPQERIKKITSKLVGFDSIKCTDSLEKKINLLRKMKDSIWTHLYFFSHEDWYHELGFKEDIECTSRPMLIIELLKILEEIAGNKKDISISDRYEGFHAVDSSISIVMKSLLKLFERKGIEKLNDSRNFIDNLKFLEIIYIKNNSPLTFQDPSSIQNIKQAFVKALNNQNISLKLRIEFYLHTDLFFRTLSPNQHEKPSIKETHEAIKHEFETFINNKIAYIENESNPTVKVNNLKSMYFDFDDIIKSNPNEKITGFFNVIENNLIQALQFKYESIKNESDPIIKIKNLKSIYFDINEIIQRATTEKIIGFFNLIEDNLIQALQFEYESIKNESDIIVKINNLKSMYFDFDDIRKSKSSKKIIDFFNTIKDSLIQTLNKEYLSIQNEKRETDVTKRSIKFYKTLENLKISCNKNTNEVLYKQINKIFNDFQKKIISSILQKDDIDKIFIEYNAYQKDIKSNQFQEIFLKNLNVKLRTYQKNDFERIFNVMEKVINILNLTYKDIDSIDKLWDQPLNDLPFLLLNDAVFEMKKTIDPDKKVEIWIKAYTLLNKFVDHLIPPPSKLTTTDYTYEERINCLNYSFKFFEYLFNKIAVDEQLNLLNCLLKKLRNMRLTADLDSCFRARIERLIVDYDSSPTMKRIDYNSRYSGTYSKIMSIENESEKKKKLSVLYDLIKKYSLECRIVSNTFSEMNKPKPSPRPNQPLFYVQTLFYTKDKDSDKYIYKSRPCIEEIDEIKVENDEGECFYA